MVPQTNLEVVLDFAEITDCKHVQDHEVNIVNVLIWCRALPGMNNILPGSTSCTTSSMVTVPRPDSVK